MARYGILNASIANQAVPENAIQGTPAVPTAPSTLATAGNAQSSQDTLAADEANSPGTLILNTLPQQQPQSERPLPAIPSAVASVQLNPTQLYEYKKED